MLVTVLICLININSEASIKHKDSIIYVTETDAKLDSIKNNYRFQGLTKDIESINKRIDDFSTTINWGLGLIGIVAAFLLGLLGFFSNKKISTIIEEKFKEEADKITDELIEEAKTYIKEKGEELLKNEIVNFKKVVEVEVKEFRVLIDEKVADISFQKENPTSLKNQTLASPQDDNTQSIANSEVPPQFVFRLAFNEKSIERKLGLYTQVLKLNKNHYHASNNIGVLYQELGNHKKAIEYFDKSIASKKEYYLPYINKSISLRELKDFKNALKVVNQGIELNSSYPNAYMAKAMIFNSTGKPRESIELMEKAVNNHKGNPILLYNLGFLYYLNKQYDLSIQYYLKAFHTGYPNTAQLMNNVAVSYRLKGDYDTALDYLEKAKSFNIDYPMIYGTTALIYADKGDDKNFYKYIEISLKHGCPIWDYLEDKGFDKYRDEKKLKDYIKLFKGLDRNTLF